MHEWGPYSVNLVTSISLPDGSSYSFAYKPNSSGGTTGRLASVTLPTGGQVNYAYSGPNGLITCADGTAAMLTRTTPDGVWSYSHAENGGLWADYSTDPAGNVTQISSVGVYETQRTVHTGSSTLLETVNTCYNGASIPCTSTAINFPVTSRTVQVSLPGVSPSQTTTNYNSYGLPTETDEYDWGPTMARKTLTGYGSCGVTNQFVVNRPCSVTIENGSGAQVASATYTYDTNGNLLSQTSAGLTSNYAHNSNGALSSASDVKGNSTSFTYTSGSASCGGAFPTSISTGALQWQLTWNCNGGEVTQVKDPNTQPTNYSYDELWRLTTTGYPDGGQVTNSYPSPNEIDTTTKLSSSSSREDKVMLDGLGRPYQSILATDPDGATTTATSYDSLGRVATVSNPYRGSPNGVASYSYDALNRVTAVTDPDGNSVGTSYSGSCATTTDEAGKARKLCADGLGRTTSVTEDPSGLNYQTTYTYDALNDLTGVTQGSQTRTYHYDGLGRLTSATTPEANYNTRTFTYPTSGALCSGDPSEVCSRTDERGITTTYGYDSYNRLTSKTYSDGTPAAQYTYDVATLWGNPTTNALGRLVAAVTMNGAMVNTAAAPFLYDAMGRVTGYFQCTPANCGGAAWMMNYTYDLAGDVTSLVHPGGFTLTNTISGAQRVTQVTSSRSDATHPPVLAQGISYTPWGAISSLQEGCVPSGSCTNIQETRTYNNRMQLTQLQLGTSANPSGDYSLAYNYNWNGQQLPQGCSAPAQGTGNNGSVMGYTYTDSVYSSLSHNALFAYDGVNRLACAQATGNLTYNLDFSYDRWGNMSCATNQYTNGPCPNLAPQGNPFYVSGFTYDAAGDITNDGTNTYQWDAEGRLTNNNSVYNAFDQQVYYTVPWTGMSALFDPWGTWLGTSDASSIWIDETYAAGRKLAVYSRDNNETYFPHPNVLGSTTMDTNHSGTTTEDEVYYPWGQGPVLQGTAWEGNWAGFPNNYQTWYRTYDGPFGRWLSPDRLAGDVSNPQSLNRYAYALNNPTSLNDPSGLDPADDCSDWESNASCEGPPYCPGGYFDPSSGCVSTGAGTWTSPPPPTPPPAATPAGGDFEALLGQGGCIPMTLRNRIGFSMMAAIARILSHGGDQRTKSFSVGWGGSVGAGAGGWGSSASVSWVNTVDVNGNAVQTTTYQISPAQPGVDASIIAGVQIGSSNSTVPTTAQSSVTWGADPTRSVGLGWGLAGTYDSSQSGNRTITVGGGAGVKGVSAALLPVLTITGSMPYCGGGKFW